VSQPTPTPTYRLNDRVIHIGSGRECCITELRTLTAEGRTIYLIFAATDDHSLFIGPDSDFRQPEPTPTPTPQPTVTLSDGTPATVGARVLKVTGEYHIEGTIVAVFHKADGTTPRLVVEHEAKPQGSFLHIYGPANLKALPDEVRDIPAILPVGARVATAFGMGTIAQVLEDHPALPALYRVQLDNGARILVSSRAEGFRAVKENQE